MCGGGGEEGGEDASLEGENAGSGFFAGLDAGLVMGVDVDEGGVESDGAFKEGDEGADGLRVEAAYDDGEGFAAGIGECLTRAEVETVEVVSWCDVGGDFDGVGAVLEDVDKGDEEVVDAVTELLDVGMLVCGAFVAVDGESLVDGVSVEVEGFAEGFHDELLEVS